MSRYYKIRCEIVFKTQDDVDYADMLVSATHEMERLEGTERAPYSGTVVEMACDALSKKEYAGHLTPKDEDDY